MKTPRTSSFVSAQFVTRWGPLTCLLTVLLILPGCGEKRSSSRKDSDRQERTPTPTQAPAPEAFADFPLDLLPPAGETAEAVITPDGGGSVELPCGARLDIPAGAVGQDTAITLSRLDTAEPGWSYYRIDSDVKSLAQPAKVLFPVEPPEGMEEFGVEVLHCHNDGDRGRNLPVTWKLGDRFAAVEMQELSMTVVVIGVAGVTTELGMQAMNTNGVVLPVVRRLVEDPATKPVLIRVPRLAQGEGLWCWATCVAMLGHAGRGGYGREHLPEKPPLIAAVQNGNTTWPVGRTSGLSAWRMWRCGGSNDPHAPRRAWVSRQPWQHLMDVTGGTVEILRWNSYASVLKYVIECLSAGYPVAMDIQSQGHFILIVGFDEDGLYVQDPAVPTVGVGHTTWVNFLTVLRSTGTFAGFERLGIGVPRPQSYFGAVHTVVVKKRPLSVSPLSISQQSCEGITGHSHLPPGGTYTNGNGCYFLQKHIKDTSNTVNCAGFLWDAEAERTNGYRLVIGPDIDEPLEYLPIGRETQFGYFGLEIGNVSRDAAEATLDIRLVEAMRAPDEVVLLEDVELTVPSPTHGQWAYGDSGFGTTLLIKAAEEVPVLELMEPGKFVGKRECDLWVELKQNGRIVDCLRLPLTIWPFRIDDATITTYGDVTHYQLEGSGMSFKDAEPVVTIRGRQKKLSSLSFEGVEAFTAANDTTASFSLPTKLRATAVCLRTPDGLETNIYDLVERVATPVEVTCTAMYGGPSFNEMTVKLLGQIEGPKHTVVSTSQDFTSQTPVSANMSAGPDDPIQVTLTANWSLAKGNTWDAVLDGSVVWRFSNPRWEYVAAGIHSWENPRTQPLPTLTVSVPAAAALDSSGSIAQYDLEAALAWDLTIRHLDNRGNVTDQETRTTRATMLKFHVTRDAQASPDP